MSGVTDLASKRAAANELTRPLAEALGQDHTPVSESTLRTFPDLIQGTDEWYEQRRGMITASSVGGLLTAKDLKPADNTTSRGLVALLAAERITGWVDPTYVSDDMLRGHEDEPRAVDVYSKHFAPVKTIGFMVRSWGGCRLGYSPDGLVGDDGLVEVKAPRPKTHVLTALGGTVPAEHMAQLQAGLFVSGREWIDFISFAGGMRLYVRRVLPDPRWFAAITAAVEVFETNIADTVTKYNAATDGMPMTERIQLEMVI